MFKNILLIFTLLLLPSSTFSQTNNANITLGLTCSYSDFCIIPYNTISKVLKADFDNATINKNLKQVEFHTSKNIKIKHYLADDGIRFIVPSETEFHLSEDEATKCDQVDLCVDLKIGYIQDNITFSAISNDIKLNVNIFLNIDSSRVFRPLEITEDFIFIRDDAGKLVYNSIAEIDKLTVLDVEDGKDIMDYIYSSESQNKYPNLSTITMVDMNPYGVVTNDNPLKIRIHGNWKRAGFIFYDYETKRHYWEIFVAENDDTDRVLSHNVSYKEIIVWQEISITYPNIVIKARSGNIYFHERDFLFLLSFFRGNCKLMGNVDMVGLDKDISYANIKLFANYINISQYQKISPEGNFIFKDLPNIDAKDITYNIDIQDLKGNRSELIEQKLVCEPLATQKQGENDKK